MQGAFIFIRGNFVARRGMDFLFFAEKSLSYVQNNFVTENTKSSVFKPLLKLSA